jgi:ribosomal-protein-alanine acetyltransferase
MVNVRISLGRPDDAAAIADMSRRLIEAGLPWSWNERRVRHCVKNPDCVVLAARDRRRLVGFAIMEFYDEHAHLNLLAVQPGFHRQGVGRRLLEWLEASARTAGIFTVHLELRAGNDSARLFYRKLGYRESGRARAYYAGREDALRMSRDLTVVPTSRA